jgi:hypothetical protein
VRVFRLPDLLRVVLLHADHLGAHRAVNQYYYYYICLYLRAPIRTWSRCPRSSGLTINVK